MRQLITYLLLLGCCNAVAQVIVTPQFQRTGLLQKQQLWNMLLTNTSNGNITGHLQIILSDNATGQAVLSGTAKSFVITPGNMQINASLMEPVQYTQLSGNYVIDPGPNGFLPLGNFSVCINYFRHESDAVNQIAEECDFIEIEPLSPPQLVMPADESQETQPLPSFSWLPPAPANFFTNLRYDLDVVEVYPGQSAADAVQQNIPLLHQPDIVSSFLLYAASAPALEYDKQYAWRIMAKSNGTVVSTSEIWSFTLAHEQNITSLKTNGLPYSKLTKADQPGYSLQVNFLKFEYLNEAGDSTWNAKVYDVTTPFVDTVALRFDTILMKPGQNLINLDLTNKTVFTDRHYYLLELTNQWNEKWRLRFEFRRKEDQH